MNLDVINTQVTFFLERIGALMSKMMLPKEVWIINVEQMEKHTSPTKTFRYFRIKYKFSNKFYARFTARA